VNSDYVLPDFTAILKGFCKPREEMVLSGKYESGEKIIWANERFAVPEILFNPSDIGIQEMEILSYSIQNKSNAVLFFKKHCLTGGKIWSEVRWFNPTDSDVSVVVPDNRGKLVSGNDDFEDTVVIRKYYEENGHSICEEKLCIEDPFLKVLTDCDKSLSVLFKGS
ncbi:hypothetical protein K5549_021513, partial [Capra hircus]